MNKHFYLSLVLTEKPCHLIPEKLLTIRSKDLNIRPIYQFISRPYAEVLIINRRISFFFIPSENSEY
tara:strand:- start:372 stop:572 length:201 start_codon:yes stop_codon:yes gene_type:complete